MKYKREVVFKFGAPYEHIPVKEAARAHCLLESGVGAGIVCYFVIEMLV